MFKIEKYNSIRNTLGVSEELTRAKEWTEEIKILIKQQREESPEFECYKRFWNAVTSITSKEYSPEQRILENFSFELSCQALDLAFGKKGALIQPSHNLMQFSLIGDVQLKNRK